MKVLYINYTLWKEIVDANAFTVYEKPLDVTSRHLWAGEADIVYRSNIDDAGFAAYEIAFPAGPSRVAVADEDEAIARIIGLATILSPRTARGYSKVEIAARDASRLDQITINYCDRTTWYPESVRVTDEVLTDSGDLTTWTPAETRPWIDLTHGKITGEFKLRPTYAAVVTVDDVAKTENYPETTDGDYSINYNTGAVTFNSALSPGSVVKASYSYENGSMWSIKPAAGKQIRITQVEVQMSENLELTDTVIFEPYGPVEMYAPHLVNDVDPNYVTSFPTGTMIPLGGKSEYQTMQDYINEAEESFPTIPKIGGPSWRGMKGPEHIFRWPYERRGTTDITASSEVEIRIMLRSGIPFIGDVAIVTFYGVSADEGSV